MRGSGYFRESFLTVTPVSNKRLGYLFELAVKSNILHAPEPKKIRFLFKILYFLPPSLEICDYNR